MHFGQYKYFPISWEFEMQQKIYMVFFLDFLLILIH